MDSNIVVEKNNTLVVEVDKNTILVVEKDIKVIENGGSSAWGGITGDIELQLDLKNKLDSKIDIEVGKGLSSNDYTDLEKQKLFGIENNANYYVLPNNVVLDSNYVHTDNNFTTEEKNKLANQSGTNTGDETQSSINAKIGYTPANDSNVVHNTGNETILGAKTFSNEVILNGSINVNNIFNVQNFRPFDVRQADGKFRIRSGNTGIMFGRNTEFATTRVQQHEVTAVANVHKITNSTTGATIKDGFDIGITGVGIAQIKQLENLNLEFYTNDVKVGDISNTGVWANNSGTWSTLSDERLKENIKPVSNALEKCLALAECVRHYTFKNQTKYATGKRTGYIAQLLRDNGFEGHITYNKPVDEEEGVLLGWEYADELYKELESKFKTITDEEGNETQEEYQEEVEKTRRMVVKEGEMILGIENNFIPYVFGAIEELDKRLKRIEVKLGGV